MTVTVRRVGVTRGRAIAALLAALAVSAATWLVAAPAGASSDNGRSSAATLDGAVLSAAAATTADLAVEQGVVLSHEVLAELDQDGTTNFWVVLDEQADLSGAYEIDDWAERGQYVYDRLTETARASQAELTTRLATGGVAYEAFWISNRVLLHDADLDVLDQVLPTAGVAEIQTDEVLEIPEPLEAAEQSSTAAVEWGIENIQADQVWSHIGSRGEGIVVGSIDSGVEYEHPALVNQYRGNLGDGQFSHDYHWWDPSGNCSTAPCDEHYHGTHVTGTMVGDDGGDNQIGVAPRAQWIAARGCPGASCPRDALLSAGEFMLAPTNLDGEDPSPELRPHVVNNSWGGSGGDDFYDDTVAAWAAAGMFPVFSSGNSGPGCATVGSPADGPDGYAVGAYDIDNQAAAFSSRGPGRDDQISPHISAPGVSVRSSVLDGGYQAASGTSMAGPHVAGTVALMWSASGTLGDIDGTRQALNSTAIATEDSTCGGTPENNNVYGQGRLDALEATAAAALDSGVVGQVADADTGEAAGQIRVEIVEVGRSVITGTDGGYRLPIEPGTYTLEASQHGNVVAVIPDVVVDDEAFTTVDIALGGVRGEVTDADGDPLEGVRVEVAGAGDPVTTDADGRYTLRLAPDGYALDHSLFAYVSQTVPDVAVTEAAFTTVEVELELAPHGTLAGTVTDQISGHTVPHARVEVRDVPVDLSVTTDADGNYEITGIPVETYELRVTTTRPDVWWPAEVEVTVPEGAVADGDVALPIAQGTTRVSYSSDGVEADDGVRNDMTMSTDGRYLSFDSRSTNLTDVPLDDPLDAHVYVRDRVTGVTELVESEIGRDQAVDQGTVLGAHRRLSEDGRYVSFSSTVQLTDEVTPPQDGPLVPEHSETDHRVYVRDNHTGETQLASVNSAGERVSAVAVGLASEPPFLSADGQVVTFATNTGNVGDAELPACIAHPVLIQRCYQVAVHDRETGITELVSVSSDGEPGNGGSHQAAMTPDGRYVAFTSNSTNLVEEELPDDARHVFVHDRETGTTEHIPMPGLDPDTSNMLPGQIRMSDDGQFVFFGDTLAEGDGALLAIHDRATGEAEVVQPPSVDEPVAISHITLFEVSGDARYVFFGSSVFDASFGLITEASGAMVLDRQTGEVEHLIEETYDGSPRFPGSGNPGFLFTQQAVSGDGSLALGHASRGEALMPGPTNGQQAYLVDRDFDPATPDARFISWDVAVDNPEPQPGAPVEVTAKVKNVGNAAGDYDAVALLDSRRVATATETVPLAPGETAEVSLTIHPEAGGDRVVRIGQASAGLRVQAGTLAGEVTNANNDEPLHDATVTATVDEVTHSLPVEPDGSYRLDNAMVGTWTVTVTADGYVPETFDLTVTADGELATHDVALRTGVLAIDDESLEVTVPAGGQTQAQMAVSNAGTAELAWHGGTWETTVADDPSILVYQSVSTDEASDIDHALQRLGVDYTDYREHEVGACGIGNPDNGQGMEAFSQALVDGEWDLVVVSHQCTHFQMHHPTIDALVAHLADGGRLIYEGWQAQQLFGGEATRPDPAFGPFLTAMDVEFFDLRGAGRSLDLVVFWWDEDDPLFTSPLPVPEHVGPNPPGHWQNHQMVAPLDGARAVAGYTSDPVPEAASLVIGNDGRSLYKGHREPSFAAADRDRNGTSDQTDLWINSITTIGDLTVRQPWLSMAEQGTLAPDGDTTATVTVDATHLAPGAYTGTVGLGGDGARDSAQSVPVTVTVTESVTCDHTIDGVHFGPLTVTDGITCITEDGQVTGPVTVAPEAGLLVTGGTVTGRVTADGAELVELRDGRFTGPVTVTGTTGNLVVAKNQITGQVRLSSNTTGDSPIVVSANRIIGSLSCDGNEPPPVNDGDPNVVTGRQAGQCADL